MATIGTYWIPLVPIGTNGGTLNAPNVSVCLKKVHNSREKAVFPLATMFSNLIVCVMHKGH